MGQFGPFSPLPEEIQFLSGGNRRRHSPRTVAHSALPHATMQNQACDRAMSDRLLELSPKVLQSDGEVLWSAIPQGP